MIPFLIPKIEYLFFKGFLKKSNAFLNIELIIKKSWKNILIIQILFDCSVRLRLFFYIRSFYLRKS
jgi:hypothetical protein